MRIIKLGLLWVADAHNWFEAKCASYGLGEKILISAEKMQAQDLEARSQAQKKAERYNL